MKPQNATERTQRLSPILLLLLHAPTDAAPPLLLLPLNQDGWTPLHFVADVAADPIGGSESCMSRLLRIVKALVAAGADINAKDEVCRIRFFFFCLSAAVMWRRLLLSRIHTCRTLLTL